jgi:hypothetical protein
MRKLFHLVVCLLLLAGSGISQAKILIGDNSNLGWSSTGQAVLEDVDGKKVFTVRNGGSFYRDVKLETDDTGKYLVFFGRGSSDRLDAFVTDLPYLYGQALDSSGKVLEPLQGSNMLGQPPSDKAWTMMYGIFKVPEHTSTVRFFLNQALRKGVERDGSAARFDNVGLFMFKTREEALEFALFRVHSSCIGSDRWPRQAGVRAVGP